MPSEDQQNGHPAESEPPANGGVLAAVRHGGVIDRQQLLFCERFVEFLIDLMSQAPTRRYSHALLEDKAVLIKCRMSTLFRHEQGLFLNLEHDYHSTSSNTSVLAKIRSSCGCYT